MAWVSFTMIKPFEKKGDCLDNMLLLAYYG
jgi:hypothetical protein